MGKSKKKKSEPAQDDEEDDRQEGSDDQDDNRHGLIPPFLPDQTVFTRSFKHRQQKLNAKNKNEPRLFEAIIKKVRHHPTGEGSDKWSFFIHFKGWNARHDCWIAATNLVPDTPENRQISEQQQKEEEADLEAQRQLKTKKQHRKKEAKATAAAPATSHGEGAGSSGQHLPFTLKTILVEEREKIMRQGYDAPYGYDADMLHFKEDDTNKITTQSTNARSLPKPKGPPRSVHALPAAVSIRQLIKHFEKKTRKQWQQKQEQKLAQDDDKTNSKEDDPNRGALAEQATQFKQEIRQFCKGLARLLEEALPVCLLYPPERPQYDYYIQQQKQSVLDVYGCEFLLRLLLRLPQLYVDNTTQNNNNKKRPPLPSLVHDLILLLQQNRPACFKGKFRAPAYPHEWLEWEKRHYRPMELHTEEQAFKSESAKTKEDLLNIFNSDDDN